MFLNLFLNLFWRHRKTGKLAPKAPNKQQNSILKFTNAILVKSCVLQYIPYENLEFKIPWVEFSIQKSTQKRFWKFARKNWHVHRLEFKKLAWTGSKLIPKSMKIVFRTTSCPARCSHGIPGCPRVAKMTFQGAPEMRKYVPEYQNGDTEPP